MPSASYIAERDAFGRQVQWLVEIVLDRCNNVYTTAPCTASDLGDGLRCFYSYQTCQDVANYSRGSKTYRFCLNSTPWPDPATQVFPLLRRFVPYTQKIDAAKLYTDPERVVCDFALDFSPPPLDHDKSATLHNTQRTGEFWRVLKARNQNYTGRTLRIKRGFYTSTFVLSDFEQLGPDYRITSWQIDQEGCSITAESPLAQLGTRSAPWSISQDNTVQTAIAAGDATVVVRDASEFPDPASYTRNSVFVEIESEICKVTNRNTGTNTLTITRGQWGTTAASHAVDKKVSHVLCVGTNNGASAATGRKVADVLQDLMEWAGVAAASVDTSSFDTVSQLWPDLDVLATVRKPRTIAQHMASLRSPRGILIYYNTSSKYAAKVMSPDLSLTTFTDDNFVFRSVENDEDEEQRLTRAAVWYNPSNERAAGASTLADYQNAVIVVNTDLESVNNYGDVREETFQDFWVDPAASTSRIRNFSRRIINRRRAGVRTIKFSLDLKSASINVGDGVSVTSQQILDARGNQDTRPCIVTARTDKDETTVQFEAVDLAFGGRFLRIGPDTLTDDYSTATTEERNSYGYWGDATYNRVGTIKDVGYVFY